MATIALLATPTPNDTLIHETMAIVDNLLDVGDFATPAKHVRETTPVSAAHSTPLAPEHDLVHLPISIEEVAITTLAVTSSSFVHKLDSASHLGFLPIANKRDVTTQVCYCSVGQCADFSFC